MDSEYWFSTNSEFIAMIADRLVLERKNGRGLTV